MAKPAPHRVQSTYRAHPDFIRPTAAALAVAACFSGPIYANPTAPTVVNGTATFATAGNILNVTNSHNAIINWGSFSIGINELTRFIQPSALSAVLNRVIGQDPSAILGALHSNGRVFLLNPNGIVFGAGSQINVAGLVASTLNLSNEDFLNNRMRFTDGAGAGSVVNNGSITGGSVYLVGNAVTNNGLITSPNGEVVLAAGNSVELVNPGTPNLRVEIVATDNEARNLGTITADAGRIGIYAGLIKQSGTLSADSAVSEGGRIVLKSTKKTLLEEGSVTTARGTSGGQIIALSSMTDGVTEVAGKMDASGTAGNGGFIETSAAKVKIADSAMVTAVGGGGGQAGMWLIDPNDFYISSYGGNISGATLASQLSAYGGTPITISTAGGGTDVGNLYVNDEVIWTGTADLTLIAHNNLEVNNAIANSDTGGINLYAGWDGGSTSAPVIGSNGTIQLGAPISTLGDIKLIAGGAITQGAPGLITANNLLAISSYGPVNLSSAVNAVNTIAGSAIGAFQFKNSGNLTIGTVAGVNGITVNPGAGLHTMVNVEVTAGQLTVDGPVYARGGDGSEGQAGGNATITLASSSSMQINNSVTADGGEGGYGYSSGPGGPGGNATVNLTSGGGLTIAANVQATGGSGGYGSYYSSASGGRGGDGVVNVIVAGTLSMGAYGGSVVGQGGPGGYAYGGTAGRGGDGKVMLSAVGGITIASGRLVRGAGGNGGGGGSSSYSYGGYAFGGNGGDGVVQLASTGGSIAVAGSVVAQGGGGGSGGSSGYGNGNGGNASASLTSTGGITITGSGSVSATGGNTGGYYLSYSNGGTGSVVLDSAGPISITGGAQVIANGGDGGEFGVGGNAVVLVSSSSGIAFTDTNSQLAAFGGDAYEGQGGAAGVTVLAGGSIQIEGAEGAAWGGQGDTGGSASVLVVAGSNIDINGNGGGYNLFAYSNNGSASSSVVVASAGNMTLSNGANIYADGVTGLGGANIFMDSAYVFGETGVSASATGSLSLMNGSELISGGGNAYITTGGDVSVDNSVIAGNPDVFMKVGGVINMSNAGTIEAGAPTTINLLFPMLTSGGFFVNGIEGVVFDPLTGTGFRADGSAAILGVNLLVAYGGGSLTVPTDALIVAMGESTKPPDAEKEKDVFDELKKDKEKEAPVCR